MRRCETNSPGLATLGDIYLRIGNSQGEEFTDIGWDSLVLASDRILKIVARHTPPAVVDKTAHNLATIIRVSNHLGVSYATRNSAVLQSEKARAGKQLRTDRRWRSIRCAIVWVCRNQKLKLVASDSFAESIRKDVLETAKRFGLSDARSGLSVRSIERHVAALIKDRRLLNAILDECGTSG